MRICWDVGKFNDIPFNFLLDEVMINFYMLSSLMVYRVLGNINGILVVTEEFHRASDLDFEFF